MMKEKGTRRPKTITNVTSRKTMNRYLPLSLMGYIAYELTSCLLQKNKEMNSIN